MNFIANFSQVWSVVLMLLLLTSNVLFLSIVTPILQRSTDKYHVSDKQRSSLPEMFCKKSVLKNFAKSTENDMFQSLIFNKVACLSLATLSKKWF